MNSSAKGASVNSQKELMDNEGGKINMLTRKRSPEAKA
jgi:hypothetical protein